MSVKQPLAFSLMVFLTNHNIWASLMFRCYVCAYNISSQNVGLKGKGTKGTKICKTLHKKLMIEKYEPYKKNGVAPNEQYMP
jgi:hypothetical protein